MSKSLIEIKGVSKEYEVYKNGIQKIKGALLNMHTGTTKKALTDINLIINEGDRVAVMGEFGSGRSTLIRILANITYPTKGKVIIKKSVLPMIDSRVGLDPELTGRENIYYKAAVLGIRKKNLKNKEEEIIEFSGLGNQIDYPIKTYRLGLSGRLAFAVFSVLEPEILLVDDTINVGDTKFRNKCLEKIKEIVPADGALVIVSNQPYTIKKLCNRAIILEEGKIVFDGDPDGAIETYRSIGRKKHGKGLSNADEDINSEDFSMEDLGDDF